MAGGEGAREGRHPWLRGKAECHDMGRPWEELGSGQRREGDVPRSARALCPWQGEARIWGRVGRAPW